MKAVIEAREALGMVMVFTAADGDHDGDEAHRVAHAQDSKFYLDADAQAMPAVPMKRWRRKAGLLRCRRLATSSRS
jgi:hypothetical protein